MSEQKTLTQAGIDGLDRKEFQTYAQEAFGISLDARKSKEDMVKAFVEAKGEIASDGKDPNHQETAAKSAPKKGEVDASESDPRKYLRHDVTINGQEGDIGGDSVFVSVNGHGLLIQRNKRVSIPWPHLKALENTQQTLYSQRTVQGEVVTDVRKAQALSFTDHGPTQE